MNNPLEKYPNLSAGLLITSIFFMLVAFATKDNFNISFVSWSISTLAIMIWPTNEEGIN